MNPISLHPLDLAIAASLVVVDILLSVFLRLGLHRQLLISAGRMVLQLTAVGYVLRYVFALDSPAATGAIVLVMILVAAYEVAARPSRKLRGGNFLVSIPTVAGATVLTSVFALVTAIRPAPWFDPHYAIPLVGIILGSVLNAGSISLGGILDGVTGAQASIEARLMLGERWRVAIGPLVRQSIRRGMVPVLNQMIAAGIITLPGIMTGQILAGLDPVEAVKYQVLLMFLLSGGSCLAAIGTAYGAASLLTDGRERLRLDRLTGPK
ncbi:putative ABC transport system permease protein [Luteibacter rhizovicinus]|uniref:Putative ABC transport system permease protein n=1 Tax=Luteibacter rhizovicinus TaxID=242606 RepID=A0A4R3YHA8_9GAMM|nr:iron export ABC transporter permease subunit FetB [Luteibacter rhizovicinus]TCV91441.1 putative ABC transport system permease protein [Luteibacter rhizovicinus]